MARHRKPEAPENHERWMVSYADFITLMFAFFVVMFASSQTDKARAKAISESVEKALQDGKSVSMPPAVAKVLGGTIDDRGQGNAQMHGPGGAQHATKEMPQPLIERMELVPSLKVLTAQLAEEISAGKVEINMQPRGLVVSLRQATFFPSGADAIAPETYPSVAKIAAALNDIQNPVRIEGHTDSNPIHTARFRSNWELSAARSIAMMELLSTRFSVDRNRIAIVGYADTIPAASNDTAEGRARNRRVDIVILSQFAMRTSEPEKPQEAPAATSPKGN